jgi:polyisoprenoid-binding protein YceI
MKETAMTLPKGLTPGIWTLDPAHSEVGFTVRHAGISKVRGRFTDVTAEAHVGDSLAHSSLNATVKTASFDSGDPNRDAHVRGPEFFDVEKYPEMTFHATGIEGDGDDYTLTGDLTIRGITKPVVLDATFNGSGVNPWGQTVASWSASTEINREEWGLGWNAALETGGVLVGTKIKLSLEIEAAKQG